MAACIRYQLLAIVLIAPLYAAQAPGGGTQGGLLPECFTNATGLSPTLKGKWVKVGEPKPSKKNNFMLYDECSGGMGEGRGSAAAAQNRRWAQAQRKQCGQSSTLLVCLHQFQRANHIRKITTAICHE